MPDAEHRELRYRNYYNSGIIYFDEGNFNSAAEAFREALRIDPKKTEAKRNLEISLMSIQIKAEKKNNTETRSETREIIFNYLKQHEQQQWKSRDWMPEERFTGHDY
jgi:Ca-activated chloride channel family protein